MEFVTTISITYPFSVLYYIFSLAQKKKCLTCARIIKKNYIGVVSGEHV